MNEDKPADINNDKCISCGACVYQCPLGAITDKSFIVDAIDLIKQQRRQQTIIRCTPWSRPPSPASSPMPKLGQVISGIKELGFHTVVEAALGADMVAYAESQELVEKGFLTSSCCPAFVDYIEKQFPGSDRTHFPQPFSHGDHRQVYQGARIPTAKIIFIGPCTAKKMEFQKEEVRPYVDCVLTFEELQALFDSRDMDITTHGGGRAGQRLLLRTHLRPQRRPDRRGAGGAQGARAARTSTSSPLPCDGIEACTRGACCKASKNLLNGNFIEGMACFGGCIGGAGCLTHGEKNQAPRWTSMAGRPTKRPLPTR